MSVVRWTPGPWLIHAKHRWVVPAEDAFAEPADALPICQLRDPDERLTEDETLANGFLIAASPTMYERLALLVQVLSALPVLQKNDELWGAYTGAVAVLLQVRGEAA